MPGAATPCFEPLLDLVRAEPEQVRGKPEAGKLAGAVRGAVTKTIGEGGWVYSRSRSRSDVSPLIAAAVALATAEQELQVAGANAVAIH